MKKTGYGLFIVVLAASLALVGCSDGGSAETTQDATPAEERSSQLDEIIERGTIRVGMSTFVPWAMQSNDGELIGFEIDVARRLAADMGVDIEFVPTQWSGIIPALLTGRFDVIIGGMSIKPDRNLRVNFTIPYDFSGIAMAANAENVPGRTTLEEFNNPDTVIAARLGTTAASAAERFLPNAEIRLFEQETQAVQEALNGSADAIVASAPLPAYLVVDNPGTLYLPLDDTFTKEPIGFALQKGDVDTLNYFNNWIRVVESEGWLAERKQYWFGTRDWADRVE
ncbi:MAG: transporter substrate-binding domain-containing protein [Spirochaeta sp.]|jgi:polar amino acid transport system substrate-binding protein|nr:transporter substrate-binding domain-containing protein [Spirochaeta sp.]